MQHHQPVYRTDKFGQTLAPAHAFRYRQFFNGAVDTRLDESARERPRHERPMYQPLALVVFQPFQLIDGYATGAGEACGSWRWLTLVVKSSAECRATTLVDLIGTAVGDARNPYRKSSCGSKPAHGSFATQPGVDQCIGQQGSKLFAQLFQDVGRQFFGAQLDQQVGPALGLPAHVCPRGNPSASRASK